MDEAARIAIVDVESRHPPGPARPVGPAGPAADVVPLASPGLPGATRTNFVSNRDRYPHYGLIDFHQIDAIGPARLVAFDAELLAKCRGWIVGSLTLTPFIAEVNAFFASYNINISDTDGYAAVIRVPRLTIAARINYLLAPRVMSPGPLVVGSKQSSMYWSTVYLTSLIHVLYYRGLQDDMEFP